MSADKLAEVTANEEVTTTDSSVPLDHGKLAGRRRPARTRRRAGSARRSVAVARWCPGGFEVESAETNFCVIVPCFPGLPRYLLSASAVALLPVTQPGASSRPSPAPPWEPAGTCYGQG